MRTMIALLLFVSAVVGLACNSADPQRRVSAKESRAIVELAPPATQPSGQDEDAATRARLDSQILKLDFNETDLQEALAYLRDVTGINLVTDWQTLGATGVDKNTKITLKLTKVTFETALRKVLEQAGGATASLGFCIKQGIVNVSTKDDLSRNLLTRTYDVRDLASADMFPSADDGWELSDRLLQIIQETVDRDTWVRNGGTIGTINMYQGMLVVTQTWDAHAKLAELLAQLRQARYPQWQRELMQKLAMTLARVELNNASLDEAADALRNACGLNIVVEQGKTPRPPLTLKAGGISVQQALNIIARGEGMTWTLADGVVRLSAGDSSLPYEQTPEAGSRNPSPPASQPAMTRPAVEFNVSDAANTIVSVALDREIPAGKNILWCASFQLAWNALLDYAGGPITIENAPSFVAALNEAASQKFIGTDDPGVFATAGRVGEGVLPKARAELARKFRDFTPRLLPEDGSLPRDAWVMYACILKQLPFEHPFARDAINMRLRHDPSGQAARVASFGLRGFSNTNAQALATAKQVRILWHRFVERDDADQDFIVELQTTAGDERLVLAAIPPKRTLSGTVAQALLLMAKPNTLTIKQGPGAESFRPESGTVSRQASLLPSETIQVPVLDFDVLQTLPELCGKTISAKSPKVDGTHFIEAKQSIRFKLNETGAKLVSEAYGAGLLGSERPKVRDFTFNRPFLVMLMKKDAAQPYFAAWIANDELLMKEPPPATTREATVDGHLLN